MALILNENMMSTMTLEQLIDLSALVNNSIKKRLASLIQSPQVLKQPNEFRHPSKTMTQSKLSSQSPQESQSIQHRNNMVTQTHTLPTLSRYIYLDAQDKSNGETYQFSTNVGNNSYSSSDDDCSSRVEQNRVTPDKGKRSTSTDRPSSFSSHVENDFSSYDLTDSSPKLEIKIPVKRTSDMKLYGRWYYLRNKYQSNRIKDDHLAEFFELDRIYGKDK